MDGMAVALFNGSSPNQDNQCVYVVSEKSIYCVSPTKTGRLKYM